MSDELAAMDATAQAALVRDGEATPSELVSAAIERIEALDPQLHAVIHRRFDAALDEAGGPLPDGPFTGVPMVLKDLDGWQAGEPYHGGSRFLAERSFVAPADSWLTERFTAMGAVVVGRTNAPELGLLPSTEPASCGPTHNPWDLERSPAGSSGGSAAAVAAGLVPLGHAGDGGGSIRLPASACGLVGLKPSRGRVSLGPETGEAWGGLVARLVVTRSVRDTAAVLDAVHGAGPGDPSAVAPPDRPYVDEVGAEPGALRIAVTTAAPDPSVITQPSVVAAVEGVAALLADLGHHVDHGRPPVWDDADAQAALTSDFLTGMATWTAAELASFERLTGDQVSEGDVEPHTWSLAELGRATGAVQYHEAVAGLQRAARDLVAYFAPWGGVDLLVTPTVPEEPWLLGGMSSTAEDPVSAMLRAASIVPFTIPCNVSGQPAVSLPLGWSEHGLPIGVQIIAAPGREDLLLRVAGQLERAAPWSDRRPAVHA